MKNVKLFSILFVFLFSLFSAAALDASISPVLAYTNDDLTCNPVSGSYVYKWFRDGSLIATNNDPVIESANTLRGETWRCEIWSLASTNIIFVAGRPVVINNPAAMQGTSEITVQNAPPVLNPIGNQTIDELQALTITLTATDIDFDALTFETDAAFGSLDSLTGIFTWTPTITETGDHIVNFSVTDGTDIDSETITITVNDITAPVITLLGAEPQTIEALTPYVELNATALDNYDGDITANIVIDSSAVDTNVVGTYTVTYDVMDAAGNAAVQVVRTVNVVDTTIPVITLLGAEPQTIEALTPYVELGATALDNYDGDITSSIVIDATTVDANTVGTYTVTYDVMDAAGNSAVQVTRTVNVVDTTIPVITLLGNEPETVEALTPYVDAGATALDNYDGDITANIITVNSVDTNIVGTYTVTYDVTDANGNIAIQVVRTVNVVDTTIPVITLLGAEPQTIEALTPYVELGATALDNYDGDISLNIVIDSSAVDTNVVGTYTVTYDVMDAAGNSAVQVTRTVNVVDTTIPVITLLGNEPETVEALTPYVDAGATALDNYDGDISLNIVIDSSAVDTNVVGTYTVTYDVTDANGNAATQVVRTVNVVDTTIPVITLVGANPQSMLVNTAYTELGATALDNYDGDITANIVIDSSAVNINAIGSYIVTYDVTDANGNIAVQVNRTVTVSDATAPVITLLGVTPVTVEVDSVYTDAGATAQDDVDGNMTANITTVNNVDTAIVGTYTVTYDVTDSNGNIAIQVVRTVNVVDTTIPVITLLGTTPVNVIIGNTYIDAGATALDNYDASVSIVIGGDTVDTNTLGLYVITYDATDSSGNNAVQVTRNVTVIPVPTYSIFNSWINGLFYLMNTSADVVSPIVNSGSRIENSTVTVTDSITDSTLTAATVTNTRSILRCTIINSTYDGSTWGIDCIDAYIDPSTVINSNVTGARITDSTVINSIIPYTNVTGSYLFNVNLDGDIVTNSDLTDVIGTGVIVITDSNVSSSVLDDATIDNSNVTDSTITDSTVTNSNVDGSTITNGTIIDSTVTDSTLTNVDATNSTITGTTIANVTFTDANVSNGNIISGNVTVNGTTYTINNTNFTGIIPVAPIASFTASQSYMVTTITQNSYDANNDIVSWFWDFGDNQTSTAQNPGTHSYAVAGTYTISLILTDSLGMTSNNATATVNPSTAPSAPVVTSSSSSHSGSSSYMSGPLKQDILLAGNQYIWDLEKDGYTITKTIRRMDTIMFTYQDTTYSLIVDSIDENNEIILRVSPTEESRQGIKFDNFNFNIKDRDLIVTNLGVTYETIEPNTNVKLRLTLTDPTAGDANGNPMIPDKVVDGVIKVMGEIAPPKDTSVPVGIGISAATLVVGLLLFLGIRRIWQ